MQAARPVEIVPGRGDRRFGAEIVALDLRTITVADFAALNQAWTDYEVLLFRGQKLSHLDLIAFSRRFGRIRYPDAFVCCNPVAPGETVIREPVVVFEVLSPGTSRTDWIEKLREYQAPSSTRRCVILEQDSIAATVFTRRSAGWDARALTAGETLAMPEIEVSLPLDDIYSDASQPDNQPG